MKNFIFKSSSEDSDLQKIVQLNLTKLDAIQTELRYQRSELSFITAQLKSLRNDFINQKVVDDYYDNSDKRTVPIEGSVREI